MKTEDLIKESQAEYMAAIDGTAKEIGYLLDTIKAKDKEIEVLQAANLELRIHAIQLKKWTTERIAEQFPKEVASNDAAVKASRY